MTANVTGTNLVIFHRGQIEAKAQFFHDLLSQIKSLNTTALQTIFAIDIYNEISVTASLFLLNAVGHDGFNGAQVRLLDAGD